MLLRVGLAEGYIEGEGPMQKMHGEKGEGLLVVLLA
jgi:hypothetical protein